MPRRDIGVAIGIPDPFGRRLSELRHRLGDPQAALVPPHVTLLPPTALTGDRVTAALAHLANVAAKHAPFVVHLSGAGTFRPVSPVVFVRLVAGFDECVCLEGAVRTGPLTRELSFDYHPHVTVAHDLEDRQLDAAAAALADFDARFTAGGFTLFERDDEGVWRPVQDFPLTG